MLLILRYWAIHALSLTERKFSKAGHSPAPDTCQLKSGSAENGSSGFCKEEVEIPPQTSGSGTPANGFGTLGRTRMRTSLWFLIRLLVGRAMNGMINGCVFQ
jgi:hypothetical protein